MKGEGKQKPRGMKHRIREERKREERIGLAVIVTILIVIIFISGFLINSLLNQPSTSQPISSTPEPKAAIVDHLSLTYPNQTFIQTTTIILEQAGYSVDYYPGEEVTVEFYRNLPTHDYGFIILRVHSAAAALVGEEYVEAPVSFFTSENYTTEKYVWEQATDQLMIASYAMPKPPYYFAITPNFVTSSMNGRFRNTIVVMMGCEGLNNTKMAEAFIQKGAKAYIGWTGPVTASHTDSATTHLLQHFFIQKLTLKVAIRGVRQDPFYKSQLTFYPSKAASCTLENTVGKFVTSSAEIKRTTQ